MTPGRAVTGEVARTRIDQVDALVTVFGAEQVVIVATEIVAVLTLEFFLAIVFTGEHNVAAVEFLTPGS